MKSQPVLDLPSTQLEKTLDITAITLVGVSLLLTLTQYGALPEQIPMHFNSHGVVEQTGSKNTVFLLPTISLISAIALIILCRYPHRFNYLNKITPENAAFEYRRMRTTLRVSNAMISLLFLVLTWSVVQISLGAATGLSPLFWPILIACVIVPFVMMFRSGSK